MRKSKVLEKLSRNEPVYVLGSGFFTSSKSSKLAGDIGFDCLWIDTEHRPIDYAQTSGLIEGAYAADMDTVVRVRKDSYACYFRPLEDGASGIMVPHCKGADDVDAAVENAKYPPLGNRGIDGVGLDTNYGLDLGNEYGQMLPRDYQRTANEQTFIIIQIEDNEAVDNLEEIIAAKHADIIFIGPGDLRKDLSNKFDDVEKAFDEVVLKVSQLCKKYGKHWGIPVPNQALRDKYMSMGARFFAVGSDRGAFVAGLKSIFNQYC